MFYRETKFKYVIKKGVLPLI
ncbi:hypothetical protein [Plasmodium yoelii yoelii]|uniref:Uncharacterized protein n=1 Tax=Plasmodium yoelii yoelii TaxID=73239 RepID=Q7RCV1_PLAYO|nr:hypothetical protein [Plasmodium yoelii yoelii]